MASTATQFTETLQAYLLENGLTESEYLEQLRHETAEHPMGVMQISPLQGAFMALLVKAIGATRILEVGTFTGYSSLVMAEAIGPDGLVVTCDVSDEYTAVARRYWANAGLDGRVSLRLGSAVDTLQEMIEDGGSGSFDLAFIDANKDQYATYLEQALQLVRVGGLILLDNMFMDGRVADPDNEEEGVVAVRGLYHALRDDERVDFTVVPIADGLGIVRKR